MTSRTVFVGDIPLSNLNDEFARPIISSQVPALPVHVLSKKYSTTDSDAIYVNENIERTGTIFSFEEWNNAVRFLLQLERKDRRRIKQRVLEWRYEVRLALLSSQMRSIRRSFALTHFASKSGLQESKIQCPVSKVSESCRFTVNDEDSTESLEDSFGNIVINDNWQHSIIATKSLTKIHERTGIIDGASFRATDPCISPRKETPLCVELPLTGGSHEAHDDEFLNPIHIVPMPTPIGKVHRRISSVGPLLQVAKNLLPLCKEPEAFDSEDPETVGLVSRSMHNAGPIEEGRIPLHHTPVDDISSDTATTSITEVRQSSENLSFESSADEIKLSTDILHKNYVDHSWTKEIHGPHPSDSNKSRNRIFSGVTNHSEMSLTKTVQFKNSNFQNTAVHPPPRSSPSKSSARCAFRTAVTKTGEMDDDGGGNTFGTTREQLRMPPPPLAWNICFTERTSLPPHERSDRLRERLLTRETRINHFKGANKTHISSNLPSSSVPLQTETLDATQYQNRTVRNAQNAFKKGHAYYKELQKRFKAHKTMSTGPAPYTKTLKKTQVKPMPKEYEGAVVSPLKTRQHIPLKVPKSLDRLTDKMKMHICRLPSPQDAKPESRSKLTVDPSSVGSYVDLFRKKCEHEASKAALFHPSTEVGGAYAKIAIPPQSRSLSRPREGGTMIPFRKERVETMHEPQHGASTAFTEQLQQLRLKNLRRKSKICAAAALSSVELHVSESLKSTQPPTPSTVASPNFVQKTTVLGSSAQYYEDRLPRTKKGNKKVSGKEIKTRDLGTPSVDLPDAIGSLRLIDLVTAFTQRPADRPLGTGMDREDVDKRDEVLLESASITRAALPGSPDGVPHIDSPGTTIADEEQLQGISEIPPSLTNSPMKPHFRSVPFKTNAKRGIEVGKGSSCRDCGDISHDRVSHGNEIFPPVQDEKGVPATSEVSSVGSMPKIPKGARSSLRADDRKGSPTTLAKAPMPIATAVGPLDTIESQSNSSKAVGEVKYRKGDEQPKPAISKVRPQGYRRPGGRQIDENKDPVNASHTASPVEVSYRSARLRHRRPGALPHYRHETVSSLISADWKYQRIYVDRYLFPLKDSPHNES
ncbi:unnamed protein product [Phytomonas sp. Hart1]|nr:unnamed protein product [Phytomonas sp. Hart1]|eukprot:CCW69806.1 unnamed protein product [Phytomonas sp. isolate Hart1]